MNDIPGWLAIILAPGAAGFVWALFKGIDLWRNGTSAREARAIKNITDWSERESWNKERALDALDYWRTYAGTLEYIVITKLGPSHLPIRPPLPPDPPRRSQTVEKGVSND